jgi:hypothetical protein
MIKRVGCGRARRSEALARRPPAPGRSSAAPSRGQRCCGAVFLPEAAPVLGQVLDGAQPLGALVAVEVRDDQAQWEAVLGGEGLAVVVGGQEGFGGGEVGEAEVGGVAVLRPGHDVGDVRRGRDQVQDGRGGDPVPLVVRRGRTGGAVEVGDHRGAGERGEVVERPRVLVAGGGGAEDAQVPAFGAETGDGTVVRDGPPVHMALAGGEWGAARWGRCLPH